MSSVPPSAARRSVMFCRPAPSEVVSRSNPRPSSATENNEVAVLLPQPNGHIGCLRVLRGVLQRLEHAEVDGGLELLRVTADSVGLDPHRHRCLPRLRLHGGREALVGKERRVDPAREVPQGLERVAQPALEIAKQLQLLLRLPADEGGREPRLDGEGDELLLRAVVQVALQAPSLLVLSRDQPLARRTEILDEPGVPKNQSGLRGEIGHQLLLDRGERLVRRFDRVNTPSSSP